MRFRYKALSNDGQLAQGYAEAQDTVDLETRLKIRHLELIRCQPCRYRPLFGQPTITRRDRIDFCFHLEHLTRAGIPVLDGLKDLQAATEHKVFRQAIGEMICDIENGQTISQSMAVHPHLFDAIFVNLIKAGEESGQLPSTLTNLGEALKWEDELSSQTKKLLLYPAFVATVVIGATIFLMLYMVPQLKLFLSGTGQAIPLQTRLLFLTAALVADWWPLIITLPIAGGILTRWILDTSQNTRQRADALILKLPIIGPLLGKISLARFANTFAMLYGSGISVLQALSITHGVVDNRAIRAALQDVEKSIQDGSNIAEAFTRTGLFPPLIIRMLQIGESTGGLDSVLLNVSYFYTRDIRESIGRLQSLIEPALTLLIGGLLGWIMMALIGPIYDVIGQVKT